MTETYPQRKALRLSGFDYGSAGAYFVTLCTEGRVCLFGQVMKGCMESSPAGEMVKQVWSEIPANYPGVAIDEFITMPNHVHGIIWLLSDEQGRRPPSALTLPDIMHRFKSLTTARYRLGVKDAGWPRFQGALWQRGYFDHVLRAEKELDGARRYIAGNPGQWELDRENPQSGS